MIFLFNDIISNKFSLSKGDIIEILTSDKLNDTLFDTADKVRQKVKGDEIYLRGLIEFSNYCFRDCFYCGLRKSNKVVHRYRVLPEDIVKLGIKAKDEGFMTIVLQSGEGKLYSEKDMVYIIENIKKIGLAVTLSIGEKTKDEYKLYKMAGADRFLLRIETTDQALYKKLHPNMNYNNRVKSLFILKELGYEVGTGSLIGLPEQTVESLANDIIFFKDLEADMIGLGPFIPSPNTPLSSSIAGPLMMSLKMLAITRLVLPFSNIPATTAMETLDTNGRVKALNCGANVIMSNITGSEYSQFYSLYPGKGKGSISSIEAAKKLALSIGRTISDKHGSAKDNKITSY